VTRSGRLAIIELKASGHIHLPLQAVDYWPRVGRQVLNGEIARYRYFPKIKLQQAPPLVYLVAPALRFHPATDDFMRYLSPELEIVPVGARGKLAVRPARGNAPNDDPVPAIVRRLLNEDAALQSFPSPEIQE
jgi:hypothetical protein